MEDLYEATHQNVQLAVREGLDGVYIERIAGRQAVPVLTRVGAHWPLHATGVGLVLLAHAPADVQEAVLAAPLATFTPFTIGDPAELRRTLAEIRRTGFAVSDRQITDDAFSVAAPVLGAAGPGGGCVASLSIVVPVTDPHRASWAPAVRAAANGISRQLRSGPLPADPSQVEKQARGPGPGHADHHDVAGRAFGWLQHTVAVIGQAAEDTGFAGAAGPFLAGGQQLQAGPAERGQHGRPGRHRNHAAAAGQFHLEGGATRATRPGSPAGTRLGARAGGGGRTGAGRTETLHVQRARRPAGTARFGRGALRSGAP
jgi:hypothetical protein